jgi:hypothetical protein
MRQHHKIGKKQKKQNKKTWGHHDIPSSLNFFVQNFCFKEVHVQVPFYEGGAPRA